MFKELAKIANKLDSMGLTKEADVLDKYLAKAALDGGGYSDTYRVQTGAYPNPTNPVPKTWDEYKALVGQSVGASMESKWNEFCKIPGSGFEPTFLGWARWYQRSKTSGWFDGTTGVKNPQQVLALLDRQLGRDNLHSHESAVAATPQFRGDSGPNLSTRPPTTPTNYDNLQLPSGAGEDKSGQAAVDSPDFNTRGPNGGRDYSNLEIPYSETPQAFAPGQPSSGRGPGYRKHVEDTGLEHSKLFAPKPKQK